MKNKAREHYTSFVLISKISHFLQVDKAQMVTKNEVQKTKAQLVILIQEQSLSISSCTGLH